MDLLYQFTDLYETGRQLQALRTIITDPNVKYEALNLKVAIQDDNLSQDCDSKGCINLSSPTAILRLRVSNSTFPWIVNYADACVFQGSTSFEVAKIAIETMITSDDRLKTMLQGFIETLNIERSLLGYYNKGPLQMDLQSIQNIHPSFIPFIENKITIYKRWKVLCQHKPWLESLDIFEEDNCKQPWHPFSYSIPFNPQVFSEGDIPLVFLNPIENMDSKNFFSKYLGQPVIYVCENISILFHMLQWDEVLKSLIDSQASLYLLDQPPETQNIHIDKSASLKPILMSSSLAYAEAIPYLIKGFKDEGPLLYAISERLRFRVEMERYGSSRCIAFNKKWHLKEWFSPYKKRPPSGSDIGPLPVDHFRNLCLEAEKSRKLKVRQRQKKIQITHIAPQIVDGGHAPTRLISNLIKYHSQEQFDVQLISSEVLSFYPLEYPVSSHHSESSLSRGLETISSLKKLGIPVYIEELNKSYLETAHHLAKVLDESNSDIAIFHGPRELHDLCSCLTTTPIRILFEHGTLPSYPTYDAIISSTETEQFPGIVHVLPFAINTRKEWSLKSYTKEFLGFSKDSFILTTISNHLNNRLNDNMCIAIACILKRCPQAIYAPIGQIKDPEHLYTIFNEYGVGDRVVFLGNKDIPGQYARCMELYLNEFPFGSCLGMLDAMASGCPVVSMYDKSGPPQSRYGGLYLGTDHVITSGSIDDYVNLACRLILDKEEYKKWSAYTLMRYEKYADEALYVKNFEQILLNLFHKT